MAELELLKAHPASGQLPDDLALVKKLYVAAYGQWESKTVAEKSVKDRLTEARAAFKAMNQEMSQLREEKEELERKLKELSSSLSSGNSSGNSSGGGQDSEAVAAGLQEAQKRVDQAVRATEDLNTKLIASNLKLDEAQRDSGRLRMQLEQVNQEAESLRQSLALATAQDKTQKLLSDNDALRQEVKQLLLLREQAEQERDNEKTSTTKLRKALEHQRAVELDLRKHLEEDAIVLEQQRGQFQQQIEKLQQDLNALSLKTQGEAGEVHSLRNTLEQTESILKINEAAAQKALADLAQCQAANSELSAKLANLEQQQQQQQQQQSSTRAVNLEEVAKAQAARESLTVQLTEANHEKEELKKTIALIKSEKAQVQQELEEANKKLSEEAAHSQSGSNAKGKVGQLQEEIAALKHKISTLTSEKEAAVQSSQRLSQYCAELQAADRDLRHQVEQQTIQIQVHRQESQRSINELEMQVKVLRSDQGAGVTGRQRGSSGNSAVQLVSSRGNEESGPGEGGTFGTPTSSFLKSVASTGDGEYTSARRYSSGSLRSLDVQSEYYTDAAEMNEASSNAQKQRSFGLPVRSHMDMTAATNEQALTVTGDEFAWRLHFLLAGSKKFTNLPTGGSLRKQFMYLFAFFRQQDYAICKKMLHAMLSIKPTMIVAALALWLLYYIHPASLPNGETDERINLLSLLMYVTERDKAEARELLDELQAEQKEDNKAESTLILAIYHNLVESNYAESFRYLTTAAQYKDSRLYSMLGETYRHGQGTQHDTVSAFRWYNESANADEPMGLYYLGNCYLRGIGVEKSPSKAANYLKAAVKFQLPEAMSLLAQVYASSRSLNILTRNKEIRRLYTEAAAKGEPTAKDALTSLGKD